MQTNRPSKLIATLCKSPTVVLAVIALPPRPVLSWVFWIVLVFLACSLAYWNVVLRPLPVRIPLFLRCLAFLFAQAGFWYLLIHFNVT